MKQEQDFTTAIVVDQSVAEVFDAINNVRGWWQGEFEGTADKLHTAFSYRMGELHYSKQEVLELVPNKKIVWLVTESSLSFVDKNDEWTNTTMQFDIASEGEKTKVTFTHEGLVPDLECYGGCSGAWQDLISKSLFSYISTGQGVEVF